MAKFGSVLIVDDNANCVAFMSRALASAGGVQIGSEMDPLRALARIREEKPTLVLLDIKMPGLDGFGLLAQLRNSGSAVPVVMLSGSALQRDIDRAYALGCNGYFQKPVSLAAYGVIARAVVAYWRCGELSQLREPAA